MHFGEWIFHMHPLKVIQNHRCTFLDKMLASLCLIFILPKEGLVQNIHIKEQ